jgi:hypothetical protein
MARNYAHRYFLAIKTFRKENPEFIHSPGVIPRLHPGNIFNVVEVDLFIL